MSCAQGISKNSSTQDEKEKPGVDKMYNRFLKDVKMKMGQENKQRLSTCARMQKTLRDLGDTKCHQLSKKAQDTKLGKLFNEELEMAAAQNENASKLNSKLLTRASKRNAADGKEKENESTAKKLTKARTKSVPLPSTDKSKGAISKVKAVSGPGYNTRTQTKISSARSKKTPVPVAVNKMAEDNNKLQMKETRAFAAISDATGSKAKVPSVFQSKPIKQKQVTGPSIKPLDSNQCNLYFAGPEGLTELNFNAVAHLDENSKDSLRDFNRKLSAFLDQ